MWEEWRRMSRVRCEREERRGTLDIERARLDFDLDVLYDAHPHRVAWI